MGPITKENQEKLKVLHKEQEKAINNKQSHRMRWVLSNDPEEIKESKKKEELAMDTYSNLNTEVRKILLDYQSKKED